MTNIATLTSATADLDRIVDKLQNHLLTDHGPQYIDDKHFYIVNECDACRVLADEHRLASNRVYNLFDQIREGCRGDCD